MCFNSFIIANFFVNIKAKCSSCNVSICSINVYFCDYNSSTCKDTIINIYTYFTVLTICNTYIIRLD